MKSYLRTDVAFENAKENVRKEYMLCGCRVCEVTEPRGDESAFYATVRVSSLPLAEAEELLLASRAVAWLLSHISQRLVPSPQCVLVACLGNPRITPDSLGACTAQKIQVTRHVSVMDPGAFARFGKGALCLVQPGVLGDTGLESAELVRGAALQIGADLVIAVDALAAVGCATLGAAVQICDHGLRPGAGLGNRRVAIDQKSIGCPVISLGIPTVIDSAALICDALMQAGICQVGSCMQEHLARTKGYLVAPGDIDVLIERGGELLARAISECYGIGFDDFSV